MPSRGDLVRPGVELAGGLGAAAFIAALLPAVWLLGELSVALVAAQLPAYLVRQTNRTSATGAAQRKEQKQAPRDRTRSPSAVDQETGTEAR